MNRKLWGVALFLVLFFSFIGCEQDSFTRIKPLDPSTLIHRIAFGSCMKGMKAKPVLQEVVKAEPDAMLFIGDNIYGDNRMMAEKYRILGDDRDFLAVKRAMPILATWDDHDFGVNDGGVENPNKEKYKKLFLNFFEEPSNSPRWNRGGVYTSALSGPEGKRVQIILLDTRWFRSALVPDRHGDREYLPNPNPEATMLGAEQWAWLEQELKVPAEVRIVVSSIQVLSEFNAGEKWANFPLERTKLLSMLKNTTGKVLMISGDRHHAELSCLPESQGGLCDFTSSGITQTRGPRNRRIPYDPNPNRLYQYGAANNAGLIDVDWSAEGPAINIHLLNDVGNKVFSHSL